MGVLAAGGSVSGWGLGSTTTRLVLCSLEASANHCRYAQPPNGVSAVLRDGTAWIQSLILQKIYQ